MNITDEIWNYADSKGLDWEPTGGNCDFIVQKGRPEGYGDPTPTLVLVSEEDSGMSPDHLNEHSIVMVYIDPNWYIGVAIHFATARDAMDFMAVADIGAQSQVPLDDL